MARRRCRGSLHHTREVRRGHAAGGDTKIVSPYSQYLGEQHVEDLRRDAASLIHNQQLAREARRATAGRQADARRHGLAVWFGIRLVRLGERLGAGVPVNVAPQT